MNQERNEVLVIEDNKEHLLALALKLKANQYDVVWAGDGVTAMTAVAREKPDAIMLDLGLPGGDGFGVLKRLRSLTSSLAIPVIVVTARDPMANRAMALEAGASAFLQKPVKTDELLHALLQALTAEAVK
jgi:two-component system, OmpR family, KDP operon response regulator KdpE